MANTNSDTPDAGVNSPLGPDTVVPVEGSSEQRSGDAPAPGNSRSSGAGDTGSGNASASTSGQQKDPTVRTVMFEPLTTFAQRNRVPVNRVRQLNPGAVDDFGNITKPELKVE